MYDHWFQMYHFGYHRVSFYVIVDIESISFQTLCNLFETLRAEQSFFLRLYISSHWIYVNFTDTTTIKTNLYLFKHCKSPFELEMVVKGI